MPSKQSVARSIRAAVTKATSWWLIFFGNLKNLVFLLPFLLQIIYGVPIGIPR